MRIEFDPTNPTEAAAVRAMLTAMAPASGGVVTSTESHLVGEVPSEQTTHIVFRADQFVVTNGTEEKPVLVSDDQTKEYPDPSVDRDNEPHDPRIHSTPPKLNADGTWRAKRGVTADQIAAVRAEREAQAPSDDPEELERVEDEVKEILATEPPLASAPPAPPAPTGQSEAPLAPAASIATEPAMSTEQTGSGSAPAPTGVLPSFLDVMKAITAAQKDGKIDTAKVKELCAAVGAGESTMGLNGPDNGDKRVAFMALLAEETK